MLRKTLLLLALPSILASFAFAESIWIEGEAATTSTATKHPWYHGEVKKNLLSGGDFVSHFDDSHPAEMSYRFDAKTAGDYRLWMRVNTVQAKLLIELNDAPKREIPLRGAVGNTNIASNDKPDLRFISWLEVGKFPLKAGQNTLRVYFESENHFHGALDCFVFTNDGFIPEGTIRPEQVATERKKQEQQNRGWVAWRPDRDDFRESAIDLRHLNEAFAGEHGHIIAKGDHLVRSADGKEIRFWAVNGPPDDLDAAGLANCARMLAKHGVNLVRMHGSVFSEKTGKLDTAKVTRIRTAVDAMKKEGIYSHLSIYFPLWLKPANGSGWREGYDGNKPVFGLIYFEKEFQQLYRSWLEAVLTSKNAQGVKLVDDPAVAGFELVNEDSLFFWTFSYDNIPTPQMAKLEKLFGTWAAKKHGSIDSALRKWKTSHERDNSGAGRLGFRPLWSMQNDKTLRDQETARFLLETQQQFYQNHKDFLRKQGFKGLVVASNWHTANEEIFGPLEKLSYLSGDVIDHHGYFSVQHSGEHAGWSIREGHTYSDRSALSFEGQKQASKRVFSHPSVDITTNNKPSMISETTWNRPNRYRGEAPLFYAAYGALQGTDAIVHFALDGSEWTPKPNFFVQPWTLMAPTQMGQFPATAMIFRKQLVSQGKMMATSNLALNDAFALKGSPLKTKANLDALREADVKGTAKTRRGIDPLVHFVGRTNLSIGENDQKELAESFSKYIDRDKKTVASSSGELLLDYGNGLLKIDAPAAQGASGNLKKAGRIELKNLSIESSLELGQIIVVSLDGRPIAQASKILLQVMTEEKPTGFATQELGNGLKRITNLGKSPWLFREPQGTIRMKVPDAAALKVTALDLNGYPVEKMGTAEEIRLRPNTVYYLLEK